MPERSRRVVLLGALNAQAASSTGGLPRDDRACSNARNPYQINVLRYVLRRETEGNRRRVHYTQPPLAKHAHIALALAHHGGRRSGQVHDAGRLETTVAPVDHDIHDVEQSLLNLTRVTHRQFFARQNQGRAHDRLAELFEDRPRDRVIRDSDADRAPLGILQALGRLARRLQKKRVRPWREGLQRAVLLIVDARILRDLGQVATDEREMMVLVRLTDPRDALHRRLVADVAAQRIAGIGRVNDYSTVADDRDRLQD